MLWPFEVLNTPVESARGPFVLKVLEGEGAAMQSPVLSITFLIFLFHSSFATRTLAVFCAKPAETTTPFISFMIRPATLAVVAMVVATAVLLDILGPAMFPPGTSSDYMSTVAL